MKIETVLKTLGYILLLNGLFMFISFLISFFNHETSAISLFYSTFLCVIFGVFPLIYIDKIEVIRFKEGLLIVVLGWILTCVVGMLPYLMWGGEFSLVNSWFESVSGFTTTGATILNNVEGLPDGLIFWRSSTHWIGGIGIILFVMLILPQSSEKGISVYDSELSGISKMNFQFRKKEIVRILAIVYLSLTVVETILLYYFGMSFFDAINHSFATIATGGFSTKNLSVSYYNNLGIELTIIAFMVLSGTHFGLLYGTITRKKDTIFTSQIFIAFLLTMVIGVGLVTYKLWSAGYYDFWHSLRHAAFQVASLGTTTGFATQDTAGWPIFAQMILIYFTIQCAMSGSTSGGLKFDRVFMIFQFFKREIKMIRHPRAIFAIRTDGKVISEDLVRHTLVFTVIYIVIFFATTVILTFMDVDGMTAFSASITTIGNVGPGFGGVSSLGNFANIPDFGKYVLSLNMLAGRLEVFNLFAIFMIKI